MFSLAIKKHSHKNLFAYFLKITLAEEGGFRKIKWYRRYELKKGV
tara:strand:- start:28243 stop:28377 length:135 start_codon:yes stop_codon:yes gene_type:complete